MKVIENDNIVCIDVDDTLVMWDWPPEFNDKTIVFNKFGCPVTLLPHERHIYLIKQFKARGHTVIVWSQGGYEWASEVVKALNIESLVDIVMAKPKWIVDDLPPSAWLSRSYINLDGTKTFF